jgi:hypothetical protein
MLSRAAFRINVALRRVCEWEEILYVFLKSPINSLEEREREILPSAAA